MPPDLTTSWIFVFGEKEMKCYRRFKNFYFITFRNKFTNDVINNANRINDKTNVYKNCENQ